MSGKYVMKKLKNGKHNFFILSFSLSCIENVQDIRSFNTGRMHDRNTDCLI